MNSINLTQIKLRAMNGGEFQQFAEFFLREDYDIETLSDYGAVEGTGKTRTGQPDIYFKTLDCVYAVEVTTYENSKKLKEDTKKAINFIENIDSIEKNVILFLNYEPDPLKIEECRKMCTGNNIGFKTYTNSDISYKLDYEYLDLRYDWLKIPLYSPQRLEIYSYNNASQQIYHTLSKISMVKENQLQDFNNLVNELYMNAIEHGKAHHFSLIYNHSKLIISEDGEEFDFLNEVEGFVDVSPESWSRGGTRTLQEFNSKYPDIRITYDRKNEKNIYSIYPRESPSIDVSEACEISISSIDYDALRNPDTFLNIYDRCASILIRVHKWDFFRSRRNKMILLLLQTVQHERYKGQSFIIFIPSKDVPDNFKSKLKELSEYESLKGKMFIVEGND